MEQMVSTEMRRRASVAERGPTNAVSPCHFRVSRLVPAVGIVGLLCIIYSAVAALGILPLAPGPPLDVRTTVFGTACLVLSIALTATARACVVLDEAGVHKRVILAWRSVRWEEIVEVGARRSNFELQVKNGRRLRLAGEMHSQGRNLRDDFPDYLARFAPQVPLRGLGLDREFYRRRLSRLPSFVSSPLRPWMIANNISTAVLLLAFVVLILISAVDSLMFLQQTLLFPAILMVMLLDGVVVLVASTVFTRKRKRAIRLAHPDMCWTCGYDLCGLTENEGRCPECGGDRRLQALYDKWVPPETLLQPSDESPFPSESDFPKGESKQR